MTGNTFWAMSLYLPVVAGQNIFNFEKAKSLRRDPEKGVFYAHFNSHQHRRLDISPIKRTSFRNRQECAQECTHTKSCFSFNLASKTDLHDKLTCELLPSDLYAELDRFGENANFNHFSIKTPCSSYPCKNGGRCLAIYEKDDYKCACAPGFQGVHCEIDIDECASDPCLNGGTCSDLVNSFVCSCPPGYSGVRCDVDIDECASDPCFNGGTCSDLVNSFVCNCPPGYSGVLCDVDIDECASDPCFNGGTCSDLVNSFVCNCPPGYSGVLCDVDIDECANDPCFNGGTCSDLVNSFVCNCPPGYGGILCDAVHGGYSSWEQWGICDVSCGGGSRSRVRYCTNPPPQHGGNDCTGLGSSWEQEVCNSQDCCSSTTCSIPEGSRIDCGYHGISQQQCIDKGCCFDSNVAGGVPHCYYTECI